MSIANFSVALMDANVSWCEKMFMKVDAGNNRLDELITASGQTYEQVAQKAGYSTVFVWQMAKGKRNIAVKHLAPLSEALGCAPEDILTAPIANAADIMGIWASIPPDRRELAKQVLESFVDTKRKSGVDLNVTSGVELKNKTKKKNSTS